MDINIAVLKAGLNKAISKGLGSEECISISPNALLSIVERMEMAERQLEVFCGKPKNSKPDPACKECNDELCGGTKIFQDRTCDGAPF